MTAVLAAALVLAAGCSPDGGGPAPDGPSAASPPATSASPTGSPSPSAPPAKGAVTVVSTLAEGLPSPWGLAALPDGDLLVSSRDEGTITRIDGESGAKTVIGSVPGVAPAGEGGLMGLALSPSYASDHLVYAYFTTESDNRVARMLYDERRPAGQQLGAPDTVLRGIPKGTVHNGGRIAFGPDKMLYAATGETGETGLAQDKESLGGKILRMTPDGQPAPGNPFAGSVVYSYGHRNVQGLAWDADKRLWAAEFGQNTWDELNLVEPGKNYGWPEVEGKGGRAGFVDPVAQWRTADASPSGIAVAEGSVWMAGLRGERLWRVPLAGAEPSADPQAFLEGRYGRLRTVVAAGGNKLWLVTSETDGRGTPEAGDDKILRLEVK
ncbi:PQQ-dependent sugar dehydrogenase [Streptomyces sp. WAC05374]|uniref:PQQ-dependent sugar dehydrogenase n=1 Tax=Streptomyces sp. WAC05374 TaxID=2487420 RepID=UPI000F86EE06|nr:PQQ-dependent sugar dehydrogenase [Streptomyces sp. WAC05374]RST16096.1 PQQ-dependent sugar dehydrogenase [Streptomyces sp. WAC05374]TDF40229.1 PQQ-dependent sugar dehydrogenase [Streptomyces sp. WAC05374]TDF53419.1 PQQ-dependent sugar dehydrogenase [Streptomyces sp. WAC05374]TDF59266.1 PQQ-dependent sugar dehydrogenase [Streptomyces sp. WAC05374]